MRQTRTPSPPQLRRRLAVAAVAACFAAGAQALPTAPVVVNGSASFAQSGHALTVTNSAGAIINWQQFGIAANETVNFVQPSASSAVLNQVIGAGGAPEMSRIYGTLASNGRVWLVNPAGILVGAGAVIDTAGFVASALPVRAEDFLAGRLAFQAMPGAGDVVNQGEIKTPLGGSVYLVGANVANEGIIRTPGGETILAAGQTVNLVDTATPGVKVEITGSEGQATNLGQIVAEAGRIGIAGSLVRNSGTLDASSVVEEGGRVFLRASQDVYVDGAGRIVATGIKGGRVEVLGNRVAVMDRAEIDASGQTGGGTILVGGDYQGKNPAVQNARMTYFGPEAALRANATEVGAGGTAIVWADDATRAYGRIEAQGAGGGAGGFVETSGKRTLDVNGIRVLTGGGNWLLDPTDITISGSASTSGGSLYGGTWTSSADSSTISVTDINNALAYGSVTIDSNSAYYGTGNITFASDAAISSTNPYGGLNIYAYNNLTMLSGSSINIGGTLYMKAGSYGGGTYYKSGSMTAGNITANEINLYSGSGMTINGPLTSTGSSTHLYAGNYDAGGLTVSANISALTNAELDNQRGNIDQTAGTVSAQTGYVRYRNNYSTAPTGNSIAIHTIVSNGTSTTIDARGAILDNNGSAVNITSDNTVSLTSEYGASVSNTLAISTDTAGSFTSLTATVNGGSNGDIYIRHQGDIPNYVSLSTNDASYGDIDFKVSGNMNLNQGYNHHFAANLNGSIFLRADGNLTFVNPTISAGDELALYAGNTLTINNSSAYSAPTVWLAAGSQVVVNGSFAATGGTFGIAAGLSPGLVDSLVNNTDDMTLDKFINLPTALAGNITLNSAVSSSTSSAGLLANGNITLNGGASVVAAQDVKIRLVSPSSKLDINPVPAAAAGPAYIWAKAPSTIYLDFPNLSGGGVFINGVQTFASSGGSGLFFGPDKLPASPGYGLVLTYGATNPIANTVTNTVNESTANDPTIYDEQAEVDTLAALGFDSPDSTIGGGEDEFGQGQTEEQEDARLKKRKFAQCKG